MPRVKKLTRDEELVRASKLRALIMAHVKKNPGCSSPQILQALQAQREELGASETALTGQIHNLARTEQLVFVKEGRSPLYYLPADKPAVTRTKTLKVKTNAPFQVDYVKSTGRVRLTLNDFVIEIGVVD